jgi:hypothetical protein
MKQLDGVIIASLNLNVADASHKFHDYVADASHKFHDYVADASHKFHDYAISDVIRTS